MEKLKKSLEILPLCRDEVYWTSCVLPAVICRDKFKYLKHFLELVGVDQKFIKNEYENDEIVFYTEYSLKKSALGWKGDKPGNTPDIVIILNTEEGRCLIVVEAKMYSEVSAEELIDQLNNQKEVIEKICDETDIKEVKHVALLLKVPEALEELESVDLEELEGLENLRDSKLEVATELEDLEELEVKIITWDEIVNKYDKPESEEMKELEGDYFYEMLKYGVSKKELISKGAESYGKNKTGYLTYEKIKKEFDTNGDFYVGRRAGFETLYDDIRDIKSDDEKKRKYALKRKYEVNTDLTPEYDEHPSRNWFTAKEFIELFKENEIFHKS